MKKNSLTKYLVLAFAFMMLVTAKGISVYADDTQTVTALKLTKYSDLDSQSISAKTGLAEASFNAEIEDVPQLKPAVIKVTLPEDGFYRINYSGRFNGTGEWSNNNKAEITLYGNKNCSRVIVNTITINNGDAQIVNRFVRLVKGTYYLHIKPWTKEADRTVDSVISVSIGYLPLNAKFINVTKKIDSTNKQVLITVNGLDADVMKIKKGNKGTSGWEFTSILWGSDPIIQNGVPYGIKEAGTDNGYYTIRMVDIYENVYGLPFKITEFDPPKAPVIKSYKSGSKQISGTAAVGSKVSITIGKKTYTGKVNTKGVWAVKVPTLKVGTKVSATVISPMGIKSTKKTVTVRNQAITKAKVNQVKANATKISGTAKKKAKVLIKIGKVTYKKSVGSNGKFSVNIKKIKKGTKVLVQVYDDYGNTSSYTSVTAK